MTSNLLLKNAVNENKTKVNTEREWKKMFKIMY